ncbi:MAG: GYD domain-containing protein, partial [Pseudolabrys sp.]
LAAAQAQRTLALLRRLVRAPPLSDDRDVGAQQWRKGSITMLFILSLNFTDQGIRNIKDGPKRAKAAREMAKKIGVDIKQVYLTSGESDLLVLAETANGDNMAKLALAIGSQGNVRSRTARAWTEEEYAKLVSELP